MRWLYPYKGQEGVEEFTRRLVEEARYCSASAIFRSELNPVPANHMRLGYGRSHLPRAWLSCARDEGEQTMTNALEIVGIDRLRPLLDRQKVLAAVRQALIWQAEGKVQSPPPGQLLFSEPDGIATSSSATCGAARHLPSRWRSASTTIPSWACPSTMA